jgi:hypothetical protein
VAFISLQPRNRVLLVVSQVSGYWSGASSGEEGPTSVMYAISKPSLSNVVARCSKPTNFFPCLFPHERFATKCSELLKEPMERGISLPENIGVHRVITVRDGTRNYSANSARIAEVLTPPEAARLRSEIAPGHRLGHR